MGKPGARKCKSLATVAKDLSVINEKNAMAEITKILKEEPEQHDGCLQALKKKLFAPQTAKQSTDEQVKVLPTTYIYFSQVPKYFLVGWLLKQAPTPQFTEELAWKIDKWNLKDSLRMLIEFLTGIKPTDKLPRRCLDLGVLGFFFDILAAKLGKRFTIEFVVQAINMQTGEINYYAHGVMQWREIADGLVKKVGRLGQDSLGTLPDTVQVPRITRIENNYSDAHAGFHIGMVNCIFSQHMEIFKLSSDIFGKDAHQIHAEQAKAKYDEAQQSFQQQLVPATAAVAAPKAKGVPKRRQSLRTVAVTRAREE